MSIPRRLGRLARGFVLNLQEDDRLRETLRAGRERGETIRDSFGGAFEAAWRGAAEEWRTGEEERRAEEEQQSSGDGAEERERRGYFRGGASRGDSYRRGYSPGTFVPRKFPPPVLAAYERLGLLPGASLEEISRKRRDLVKRYHPDRFADPDKRVRAEKLTAEINAAHDTIARHLYKSR